MQCSKCRQDAILYQPYSGQYLCQEHLVADIESKAKRTIRQHNGIHSGDHIVVILSGDPAGRALLFFLQKLTGSRRDIRVSGISAGITDDQITRAGNAGATRIALATTLEDCSAAILAGILRGTSLACIREYRGRTGHLSLVAPFCHIPYGEIALYARIHGLGDSSMPAVRENDPLYDDVKRLLLDYTDRHPAAPHAILNLCEMVNAAGQKAFLKQTPNS